MVVDVNHIDNQAPASPTSPTSRISHPLGSEEKSDSSSSEHLISSPQELRDRRKSTPAASKIPVPWKLDLSNIGVTCDANGLSPRMSAADMVPWTPNSRQRHFSRTERGDTSPRPSSPSSPQSPNSPFSQSSPRLVPLVLSSVRFLDNFLGAC